MLNQENGMTITEARKQLTKLPEQLAERGWAIPLTRHGTPVMALMSWDLFEAIEETLEIMSDPDTMAELKKGIEQLERGEWRPWDDIKIELEPREP